MGKTLRYSIVDSKTIKQGDPGLAKGVGAGRGQGQADRRLMKAHLRSWKMGWLKNLFYFGKVDLRW